MVIVTHLIMSVLIENVLRKIILTLGDKMTSIIKRWAIIKECSMKRLVKIEEMEGYNYTHHFTGFSFRNWSIGILYRKRKVGK